MQPCCSFIGMGYHKWIFYSEKAVVSFVNSDEMKKVGKVINLELDKRIKELSGEKENKEK